MVGRNIGGSGGGSGSGGGGSSKMLRARHVQLTFFMLTARQPRQSSSPVRRTKCLRESTTRYHAHYFAWMEEKTQRRQQPQRRRRRQSTRLTIASALSATLAPVWLREHRLEDCRERTSSARVPLPVYGRRSTHVACMRCHPCMRLYGTSEDAATSRIRHASIDTRLLRCTHPCDGQGTAFRCT